ncbi:MAG: exodeoxyribonuclease VII large subunit [Lachnospiraceae bacterium]|nr:exodeoxyribonuclease VII large subunit [Lachnospiraceae bacterium]
MSRRAYTVEQVNRYIRGLFDNEPFLQDIRIRGEISNLKYHSSGHIYFDLKDGSGKLSAAMFRNYRKGLNVTLHDGDEVIVTGDMDVYTKNGTYQCIARRIERAGEGDLFARFERLKQELSEMGMFDPEYKKPLPTYVFHLGIVTAPTGAAVRDMIRIVHRRNPCVRITLYPALVQGDGAAASISAGIAALNDLGVDAMIVGRGGGSIEDLWAFNEEEVARAIFASEVPVVSAVGHETDTTIADFVADVRAATPSEAAELLVAEYHEILAELSSIGEDFARRMQRIVTDAQQRLDIAEDKLRLLHPKERLRTMRRRLATDQEALVGRIERLLMMQRHRLEMEAARLDGLSPVKRLAGGYAWLSKQDGRPLRSVQEARKGEEISARLKDGVLSMRIDEIKRGIKDE